VRRRDGQGLVEFSLALIPFLIVIMGIVDLGRGVYMNSGVSQAAREIARVTAVHPGTGASLWNSTETQGVIATQKGLVPGLADPSATITFKCVTLSDVEIAPPGADCAASTAYPVVFVKVAITVPFNVLTPVLSMVAPTTLSSTAHIQVP
jgi:Flp pilus assembly protein TadG